MQIENQNEIYKIAKDIKPIMDLEIGWGNEILNTLIAVALDKYKNYIKWGFESRLRRICIFNAFIFIFYYIKLGFLKDNAEVHITMHSDISI